MTNRGKKLLYRFYAFLVYLIPMAVLFAVRIDHYLQVDGAVGMFGFLIIIFVVLFFGEKMFEGAKKDPVLSVSIVLFVFSIAMHFLASEMLWITSVSIVGAVLSKLVNAVAEVYANYEYKVIDGIKKKNRDPALPDKEAWDEAYGLK